MKKVLLIATLVVSVNAFGQKVSGKLAFPKGQKLEVVTESKTNSSMEVMGQSMETSVNSTVSEIFDIENADANSATIEHKVKRLVFNAEGGMGGAQSFDSEKESDMKGELGKLLEKSIKNKYKMVVDANGKVTEVKLDDNNPNKPSAQDDEMSQMVSNQLGLKLTTPKAGDLSMFYVLNGREIGAGDNWIDTASKDGTKRSTSYKVASITATDVVLDYVEDITTNTTQQIMGQEATINTTQKITGQITLDKNTKLLKARTANIDTNGSVEAQGMTIPVKGKTTATITVK